MLPDLNVSGKTRRTVLKAASAALGLTAVGSSVAHPGHPGDGNRKFYGGTEGYHGDNVADAAADVDLVGYHSLGDVGPAEATGQPEDVHTGAMTELRVHDDLAFVGMFSARGDDAQRGLAILDVSDFTRAESEAELESAELTLLSFVRNDNSLAACMDVKVSDDGNYVFVSKQAVTALFGEVRATQPNAENHGASPFEGSLMAVDVSDPGNPQVTDEVTLSHWSVGPHNGWYHQIGGEEYVFTVSQTETLLGGVNTFRFDRQTGQLTQVNHWDWEDNWATGEVGTEGNLWYSHDINVLEDPRTGIPLAYVHFWDAGLRVFDVSDPLDVQEVGVFEMDGAHNAVPAPTLVDGKRLAVGGHENPDSTFHNYIEEDPGETGRYHLIDCDPLDAALLDDPEAGGDPDVERVYLGCASTLREYDGIEPGSRAPYAMYAEDESADGSRIDDGTTELDSWILIDGPAGEGWTDAPGFEEEAHLAEEHPDGGDGDEDGPGEYDGFTDFRISTHNMDMDTEGRLHSGHYHAGARFYDVGYREADDGDDEGGDDWPPGEGEPPADPPGDGDGSGAGERPADCGGDGVDVVSGCGDHGDDDPPGESTDEEDAGGGWHLSAVAYFRRGKEIPVDRAMGFNDPSGSGQLSGLTASTPFFWTTVERNGVAFASCINSGPHALHRAGVEVGEDTPIDVDIERQHGGTVVTGGARHRITISVDADEPVTVRDAVPPEWEVLVEECPDVDHVHHIEGYRRVVRLELCEGTAEYLVQAPAATDSFTFGPVEYARLDEDGEADVDSHWGGGNTTTNRLWRKENGAVTSVAVLGLV